MLVVKKYHSSLKSDWDGFVERAKNSHFMHHRNYMDYHADRFVDHSLMFYDQKGKLIALLPLNELDNTLFSHQGLSFGGVISGNRMSAKCMLEIFESVLQYCRGQNISKLVYKKMPYIYNAIPSDEDLYALFRVKAQLCRRDISSAINLQHRIKYSKGRKYNLSVARKHALKIASSDDFEAYWKLLENVLAQQHNQKPVHTLEEMLLLKSRFPESIQLFLAYDQSDQLLAGTLMYVTDLLAHTQYLANSEKGREVGALDFIIDHLISEVYSDKVYFSFGPSTEDAGLRLNEGLMGQKEGFGARAVCHDFYELVL